MKNTTKKILVVDDDDRVRQTLGDLLKKGGYHITDASSGQEALQKIGSEHFDLVLLDIIMPSMSGIEALPELRRLSPKTQIIMITAFPTVEDAMEAVKKGACDYITKPFKSSDLFSKIGRAIEKTKIEKYLSGLDYVLNSLANPVRRNILKLVSLRANMRLADITQELGIDDPSKAIFHLKILRESGILEQGKGKSYVLTPEGKKIIDCLKMMENFLLKQ